MELSIITCTFNSEKYLKDCINSVIAQDLDINVYEHIFVDGYSTDKTQKIIESYAIGNKNVMLIKRKAKGVYNAMNEGIKLAKGKYILCLNSDDWLEPGIIKNYLKYIHYSGDLDIYYGKVRYVQNGEKYSISLDNHQKLREFLFYNFGCNVLVQHPATIINKNIFSELGFYNEKMKISSDYGFLLKCLSHNLKFCFFPFLVTNFRVHEGSITSNKLNNKLSHRENYFFKRKYLPRYKIYISTFLDKCAYLYGRYS